MRHTSPCSPLAPILVFTASFLPGPWCLAQVEEMWAARYGSTVDGYDQANALAVDGAGNVYVTGNSSTRQTTVKYSREGQELWAATYVPENGSFDCPAGLAVDASGDVYIRCIGGPFAVIKYSAEGREIWRVRLEELGMAGVVDLLVDGLENLLVVGSPFVTVKYSGDGEKLWTAHDEDPGGADALPFDTAFDAALDGTGNVYITGHSGGQANLVKRGPDGSLLWRTQYSEPTGRPIGFALAVDGPGNAHVLIKNWGSLDDQYLTLKFSPTGRKLWEARYQGPLGRGNSAAAIALDPAGNVCVTGSSSSGGVPDTSRDFATVKYDPEGIELWSARHVRPDYDEPRSLAVDAFGSIYVTGYSFASGITTLKYGPEGTELWSSFDHATWCDYYTGTQVLALDREGNSYLSVVRDRDYVTQKRDPDGQVLWEARHNSRIPGRDRASSIAVDADGNVHVAGYAGDGFGTIKYGPDGREIWSARFNAPGVPSESEVLLGLDPAGEVLVSGVAGGEVKTIKYGRLGEVRWVTRVSPPGYPERSAFAVDGSGNSYVVESSSLFCGPEGCLSGEFTTTKLDRDGHPLWAKQFATGGWVIDSAAAVAVGPSGAIHVVGDSIPCQEGALGPNCSWGELVLVTYDQEGTLLWVAHQASPTKSYYYAQAIAVGPGGAIHVAGFSEGKFSTIKFSRDGEELWEAEFLPEKAFQGPLALAVDAAGSVLIAGTIETTAGAIAYTVIKYDAEGREIWKAFYDGPWGEASRWAPRMALDGEGNIYLAGRSTTEFTTMKFDAGGSLAWAAIRPGETSDGGSAFAVALDSAGDVLVTGEIDNDFATVKYRQSPLAKFMRGDCNADGDTGGVTDAVFLLTYIFLGGPAPPCRAACDVNGDGDLSGVNDAVSLLAYIFLAGPAPVPPFPGCGPSAPRDAKLGCGIGHSTCR